MSVAFQYGGNFAQLTKNKDKMQFEALMIIQYSPHLIFPHFGSYTFITQTAVSDGVNIFHVLSRMILEKEHVENHVFWKAICWAVKQTSDDIKYGAPVFIQVQHPKIQRFWSKVLFPAIDFGWRDLNMTYLKDLL